MISLFCIEKKILFVIFALFEKRSQLCNGNYFFGDVDKLMLLNEALSKMNVKYNSHFEMLAKQKWYFVHSPMDKAILPLVDITITCFSNSTLNSDINTIISNLIYISYYRNNWELGFYKTKKSAQHAAYKSCCSFFHKQNFDKSIQDHYANLAKIEKGGCH